jgi:DNA-binding NarL/FixJ family response regulator
MSACPCVLIVDDQALVRRSLRRWLGEGCVIEEADSVASARARLATAHYDVILLDQRLGDEHGSALLAHIPATTAVVAMSAELCDHDFAQLGGRPDAILPKAQIRLVRAFVERALALRRAHPDAIFARFADHFRFAAKERQVAEHAWNGHTDDQIAAALELSIAAVESTWKRIYNKTGSRRPQLDALRRGWDPTRDGPFRRSGACPATLRRRSRKAGDSRGDPEDD